MIYPNIVPENNLRLPDALTIKYGPAPLLSKFVLEGDKLARRMGIRLRLRYDFGELLYVNKHQVARGNWYPLLDMFNHEYCDLIPENSYWISGEDEWGDIILTQAGRIYYWPDTSLEQEARLMFYADREKGQQCIVTASAARLITGVAFYAGAHWIHPHFRGHQLSHLLARLGRAYALSRWPIDWGFALTAPIMVEKGVTAGYGYKHASHSIFFPGSAFGETVISYLSAAEAYTDLTSFLATELSSFAGISSVFGSRFNPLDHTVTRISDEGVFQGNSSRS
jgi:hypothetical protein